MVKVLLENLTKRFGKVLAVDHLNIEVNDREFMCMLGPSGCGKTTTLRCIAGIETPDEGNICFDDTLVNDLRPAERDIAMVFQFYALYPGMTAYENLAFPLEAKKLPKDDIRKKVNEIAEILGIKHILMEKTTRLDEGQRQRVALGRALVRSPRVYLLDEPLTNLDAKLRAHMRAELKRLQRELGQTTIYVTHDQIEAMAMADRIAVINLGRLQQYDTPDEIYYKPRNMFVAGFIGSPAMNFIDGTFVEKKNKAFLDTGVFMMDFSNLRDLIKKEATGPELILGVRPEDITLNKARPSINSYEVVVDLMEPVGHQLIIDLKVDGHTLKVLMPATFEADIGEKVWMTFNRDRIHIIDKKTEKTIV